MARVGFDLEGHVSALGGKSFFRQYPGSIFGLCSAMKHRIHMISSSGFRLRKLVKDSRKDPWNQTQTYISIK